MEHSLAPDVEQLLQNLQSEQFFDVRKGAVSALAQLSESNLQIVEALITSTESDSAFLVRKAAREALQAPAQNYMMYSMMNRFAPTAQPAAAGGGMRFPIANEAGGFTPTGWGF